MTETRTILVVEDEADAHIRRLRRRIERNDARPEPILTVRGVGYKFHPGALNGAG